MPGVAGMWAMRAVTFVEARGGHARARVCLRIQPHIFGTPPSLSFLQNHDTGPPLSHWPFPALELAQGYCYILTHPGTPCVLWSHWDSKAQPGLSALINALVALRRSARITAKSTVVVLKANSECYAACIDARVVMKIGWGALGLFPVFFPLFLCFPSVHCENDTDAFSAFFASAGQYSPNTNHLEGVHWTRAVEERNCCVWLRDQPASAVAR